MFCSLQLLCEGEEHWEEQLKGASLSLFHTQTHIWARTHTHTHTQTQTHTGANSKGAGWLRNANDVLVTSAGTRIHSKHKIPLTVNGWCIWNSTKGGFNGSNTVANSQQSAIIQSTLLLIILFQEEQATAEAKKEKEKKQWKDMSLGGKGRARQRNDFVLLIVVICDVLWSAWPL